MAQPAGNSGWLKGRVKAVTSGDTLVIMGLTKAEIPPEKTVVLAHLSAPRLARRGGQDDPFAWNSREFLRKLCIGKDVVFRTEYTIPNFSREFCSVFIGTTNVGNEVVTHGWAKVKEDKGEVTPEHSELLRLEEQARQQGIGLWDRSPGSTEASIRNLPPSAVGDLSNLDAMSLLASNKGKPMEAIVEQVRDGSSLRVYLLPEFQFVQVFVAGIQAPSMGRRMTQEPTIAAELPSDEPNGETNAESRGPLTSAQRIAAPSTFNEVSPDAFGREAKHFTEIRVLNRDVRIVLEGVDKFSNLIGSVYYSDGKSAKDLAMELIENGYAKYVEWSASMMEDEARRKLKAAELQAKKMKLRLWTNYVPPATNSTAISDNFTGKVVEVVSGDCIIVADDSLPFGSPAAERRVNLSSIRCPKLGNPRREEKPAPYAREAREFLRTRLIGCQVQVSMEYSRKVPVADGSAAPAGPADSRVMGFGSVFLLSQGKEGVDVSSTVPPTAVNQQPGVNVAELIIARGFGTVIRHRDFEERSNHYENLLAAESRATTGRKGIHSAKDPPSMHVTDLLTASAKKAKDFLPFLQRNRRMTAVVEYVLSGHRFKLFVPKETCSIPFSISGVRCPGRDEPYSNEAISLMRRKIMQRDVEIEVETVDRTGTFIGSLWESKTNVGITLLESGLARLQTGFGADRIPDAHLLAQAEQSAKKQKLKIWENYVEGEEVTNGATPDKKQKEEFKAVVTEVLSGGKFYVQAVADQKVSSMQQQLASLNIKEAPVLGAFNPKKGDIVLAQFSADKSWNRAMVVSGPRGAVQSTKDKFEVFYIDYGNQEAVTYNQLRPLDATVSSAPGLAQLCQLAYLKVPTLEEDYGQEAAMHLSECTLNGKEFKVVIEERDTSGGKVKGQGTGTILLVTLIDEESDTSINSRDMFKIPDHQVAGHQAGSGKLGPLIDDTGRFYKPLQSDKRGYEEVAFYESFSSSPEVPEHIRKYFPVYYGTKVMKGSTGSEHPHIVLQDLASSRVNPSIMDIKIGSRTWGPDASEEYIAKCLKKDRESTSIPLGFRLSGLRVYVNEESEFYKPHRDIIRKTGFDDVKVLLRKFVSFNPSAEMDSEPDCGLASSVYGGPNGILAQLLELKAWFEDQTIYHFYACSLLFTFEKGLALKGASSTAEVKLIDFAHVTEGKGVIDHNFLGGLCSLINFISDILTDRKNHIVDNSHARI